MRSFLGLVNYVAKFIPHLATETDNLRTMIHKNNEFVWTTEKRETFNRIKELMCRNTALGYYNPDDDTIVVADASPVGLGAVLIQENSSGPRIICYASKSLSITERKYSQMEKEALGLVWAVERFHLYLHGKEFVIITDHKTLETIFSPTSKPCARIERWVLRLQAYKYKVIYKPGKSNIADPLSRLLPVTRIVEDFDTGMEKYVHWVVNESVPLALSVSQVKVASENDAVFLEVKRSLRSGTWPKDLNHFKLISEELCLCDGILLRGTRIVIPQILRQRTLDIAHEGHPGMSKMKSRLRSKVWWPKLDGDVECYVKQCRGCQLVSAYPCPEPMVRKKLPESPWSELAIDFQGPMPGGEYLLVVVDYFSRYIEVEEMSRITGGETIKRLKNMFSRFGIPNSITKDGGTQFKGTEFQDFCKENNINLITSSPMWPQYNGEVERQNRSTLKFLKICANLGKDWRQELNKYLLMYRSTPHSVTGISPSKMMFGWNIRDKLPEITRGIPVTIDIEGIKEKESEAKERGKQYSDTKRRAVERTIQPGDTVLVKNFNKSKLSPNFEPQHYQVLEKRGAEVTVKNMNSGKLYKRNSAHIITVPPVNIEPYNEEHLQSDMGNIIEDEVINDDRELTMEAQNPSTEEEIVEESASRPKRKKTVPGHLEDFVVYNTRFM